MGTFLSRLLGGAKEDKADAIVQRARQASVENEKANERLSAIMKDRFGEALSEMMQRNDRLTGRRGHVPKHGN